MGNNDHYLLNSFISPSLHSSFSQQKYLGTGVKYAYLLFVGDACVASKQHLKYLLLLHGSFQFTTSLAYICLFLINFFIVSAHKTTKLQQLEDISEQRYNLL